MLTFGCDYFGCSMLDLSTLDLGMSDENEDLTKSVITPAPPLECRVGEPCGFTLSTRTEAKMLLPHGGLSVAVRKAETAASVPCTDKMDGTYTCAFPADWITRRTEFDFVVSADGEEFEPFRTLVVS